MKSKNILFLTPRFPYPLIGGDKIKSYNLLKYLSKHHNVTLVSFNIDHSTTKEHIAAIEELGVKVIDVPLNVKVGVFRTAGRLLTTAPLEVDFFTQPQFKKVVDDLLDNCDIDLAISFFMRTSGYLKNKSIPTILIAEDCRTLYMKRSYKESFNIFQKSVRYWEYRKLRNFEPKLMGNFDIVTFVTKEDIEYAKKQNPKPEYRLLTNGTDLTKFYPAENNKERKFILLTGKMDIWANHIMAKYIVKKIMPEVVKEVPNAKLMIVGANPTLDVRLLQSQYVEVTGNVPDLLPYLQKARVFLHPHSGATGIQNKLLEAMAAGCPVVTSNTGNQGIYAKHLQAALIANSTEEFVKYTIQLLKDDDLVEKLSKNCRKLIEETHSWEVVNEQMRGIIEELCD
ncbi:MAG: glycosyltransferase [bacterium]